MTPVAGKSIVIAVPEGGRFTRSQARWVISPTIPSESTHQPPGPSARFVDAQLAEGVGRCRAEGFSVETSRVGAAAPPFLQSVCLLQSRYNVATEVERLMATVFNEEAQQIQENGHLSDDDLARATGAAPSTARAWLAGTRSPTGQRAERLIELSALIERLAGVIDPDYIPVWLRKPIPALDDEKPIDLIAAGRYREVAGVISSLESPGAS